MITLLGPQRFEPSLREAVAAVAGEGPIATITAGWEDREPEDAELDAHLDGRTVNLRLHQRRERLFERDAELLAAELARRDRLRLVRSVYLRRLAHALDQVRELMRLEGEAWLLDPERADALRSLRELDALHLRRVDEINREFHQHVASCRRKSISNQRRAIARLLEPCSAVAVAGGHVAVLLEVLRLFELVTLIGPRPILAWSAGAMALSDRVVLFHDNPPQGPGNAEVAGAGLGLYPGLVVLPHARRRLRLDDRMRVSLLARRLEPSRCVILEGRERLTWDGASWLSTAGVLALTPAGEVEGWPPPSSS